MRRRILRSTAIALALVIFPNGVPGTKALWGQSPRHNCSFCHNLHGASFSQLQDWEVVEDLCFSCHGDAAPTHVDRDGQSIPVPKDVDIHNGPKHAAPTGCWDCHNHEGEAGGNLAMIQATMPTPNSGVRQVVFTARTGPESFADGDLTFNGVCEVCHTSTGHHVNSDTGGCGVRQHEAQQDCIQCHLHRDTTTSISGFAPPDGGCTLCHDTPQDDGCGGPGRRAVLGEFSRTSHHVGAGVQDSDCVVCHDQSQHQQGSVRLWNVDDPGNSAAAVVLAGDPATDATEAAKLTPFCLGCHDGNGAAGDLAPFSDGVQRPPIDVTAWGTASHNTSGEIAGCFGNGTFGCHASGHGSQKRRMLAPPATPATAPALIEEEEGFCFGCHDSDGPSELDIDSLFGQPINWVGEPAGLYDNPNLNDRHDIQYEAQTRSGARIECTSCHDPHAANAALPFILDPDPGDAHVPGTDWYFYSATADTLSEFCLDCHDGSFPDGVLDHASPQVTNIQATWGGDEMGADTAQTLNIRAAAGWTYGDLLGCNVCHSPHPTLAQGFGPAQGAPTLFSTVDTIWNKAGDSWLPYTYVTRQGDTTEVVDRYAILDNQVTNDSISGGYWCNTCHDRYAMLGNQNCWGCHRHGDSQGRF